MKIQLLSDLHLEIHPHWRATPAAGADLLVLAGDIGSYQAGSLLDDDNFGLTQFSAQAGWPTPVVFVPGNHEYDTFDYASAGERLRATCGRLGLIWLEQEIWHAPWRSLDGRAVRLLGSTLWSNFEALPFSQDKVYRAANHYLSKTRTTWEGSPMLAAEMRAPALRSQAWLRTAITTPFDGLTVVVSHFAPSLRSADPRFGLAPGTAGFCNALDDLFEHADLWLHGHLHAPSDYRAGRCRVVANPLGYARKNEQLQFLPTMCLEL